MKKTAFIIFCLFSSIQILAQQVGIWRNYSSMKSVSDAFVNSEGIWVATSGGAFFFNFKENSYEQFTKATGLGNNILTAIANDKYDKIWFGSRDGMLDVYDNKNNQFVKRILDISNSSKTQKQINEIKTIGDTAYISTDFGLSLIDVKTFFFHDTFIKFGSFISDSKIRSVYKDRQLFVATEYGVAKQKEGAVNLSAPESWENYTTVDGLPSNSVYKFIKYKDTLIVSTDYGLSSFTNNKWQIFLTQFNGISIADIQSRNDSLFILSNNRIFVYYNGKLTQPFPALPTNQSIILSENKIFTPSNNGIAEINLTSIGNYYAPDGPSLNFFFGMAVDKNSNLWACSGSSNLASGFYKYDGSKWTNYTKSDIPNGNLNQYLKVYVDPNNTIYLMSWGDGFTRYRNNKFQIFNSYNTGLVGISINTNFVVVQGLANDSRGNLWILTYGSSNKQPLAVLKTDSTWQFYNNDFSNKVIQGYDLIVDQYDTKFMVVGDEGVSGGQAVYYFNENKPIYSNDINGWGSITSSSGLNSGDVNALAIDRRGDLWIGTSAGINIIPNTRDPKKITSSDLLRIQVVNTIAVDALNQKWVGTQQGVFLISSDGTKILANYNSSNSPIPNDIIKSITIDNNTGTVYFGTDYGLASIHTSFIIPYENFSNLEISPNPIIINDSDPRSITLKKGDEGKIKIKGLMKESEIKILTITGKLVKSVSTNGGGEDKYEWLELFSPNVSSGIYLLVAYDTEGNFVGNAKFAIIR